MYKKSSTANEYLKSNTPFDNYVITTLFSTYDQSYDHLTWKGFQVFFSWAMHRETEHPSSTHARKKNWILLNKYGNKH